MGNGAGKQARLLIARTITPTHFGIGRAPGAVDLPIARDHMGYPIAPASGIKGALKQYCGRKEGAIKEVSSDGSKTYRIGCGNNGGKKCCCLFGPEPGDSTAGAGAISITDLTLLAIPVPSHNLGWVYVTTPYLLKRALDLVENTGADNSLKGALEELLSKNPPYFTGKSPDGQIRIPGITYSIKNHEAGEKNPDTNPLDKLKLGGLSNDLPSRLLIVPDVGGREVVGRGIIRYWRVRLDYKTKTVSAGPWSEEYVPPDALFIGAVIDTGWRNTYCGSLDNPLNEFEKMFSNGDSAVFVGGKGTVGKGLLKLKLV